MLRRTDSVASDDPPMPLLWLEIAIRTGRREDAKDARGRIVVQWNDNEAPLTCAAIRLQEHWVGSRITSVFPGFACHLALPSTAPPLPFERCQAHSARHVPGAVSVCRPGPLPLHTGPPVLAICLAPAPVLDGHHLVVGHVTEGLEFLMSLERYGSLPTGDVGRTIMTVAKSGLVVDDDA